MASAAATSPLQQTQDDPVWMQRIIVYLREHGEELNRYDHLQLVFNRCDDQVVADCTIKSLKLK